MNKDELNLFSVALAKIGFQYNWEAAMFVLREYYGEAAVQVNLQTYSEYNDSTDFDWSIRDIRVHNENGAEIRPNLDLPAWDEFFQKHPYWEKKDYIENGKYEEDIEEIIHEIFTDYLIVDEFLSEEFNKHAPRLNLNYVDKFMQLAEIISVR